MLLFNFVMYCIVSTIVVASEMSVCLLSVCLSVYLSIYTIGAYIQCTKSITTVGHYMRAIIYTAVLNRNDLYDADRDLLAIVS